MAAGQTLPCGITVTDSNNDGFTWQRPQHRGTEPGHRQRGPLGPECHGVLLQQWPDPTVGANDWFFTAGPDPGATQRYRVSFYYRGGHRWLRPNAWK